MRTACILILMIVAVLTTAFANNKCSTSASSTSALLALTHPEVKRGQIYTDLESKELIRVIQLEKRPHTDEPFIIYEKLAPKGKTMTNIATNTNSTLLERKINSEDYTIPESDFKKWYTPTQPKTIRQNGQNHQLIQIGKNEFRIAPLVDWEESKSIDKIDVEDLPLPIENTPLEPEQPGTVNDLSIPNIQNETPKSKEAIAYFKNHSELMASYKKYREYITKNPEGHFDFIQSHFKDNPTLGNQFIITMALYGEAREAVNTDATEGKANINDLAIIYQVLKNRAAKVGGYSGRKELGTGWEKVEWLLPTHAARAAATKQQISALTDPSYRIDLTSSEKESVSKNFRRTLSLSDDAAFDSLSSFVAAYDQGLILVPAALKKTLFYFRDSDDLHPSAASIKKQYHKDPKFEVKGTKEAQEIPLVNILLESSKSAPVHSSYSAK